MKPQNRAVALVLAVAGLSVPTVAETPRLAPELQVIAVQIDFDALHRQAREALAELRRRHENRIQTGDAVF